MTSKVSFTIRPPMTSSRPPTKPDSTSRTIMQRGAAFIPHAADSSDEDEEDDAIEAVAAFDQSGAQRLHEKPKPSGPPVIPALANRDWRAVARLRKQIRYIPDGAAAMTGKDGSQGGLGTRDSINSGPQATGLVMRKEYVADRSREGGLVENESQEALSETVEQLEISDDERARRALLASVIGESEEEGMTIDAIPVSSNYHSPPVNETDAYKQDVVTRPESATLADYERVPVSQFGAALLRGMGWKEGTAASRTRPGLVEPWLPSARPALLGIGAKERPQEDIPPSGNGRFVSKRPEKRYVPIVKVQRESSELPPPSRSRSRSPTRSRTASRVPSSNSASPYPGDHDADRRRRRGDHGSHREQRGSDRDPDRDRRGERSDKERHRDHRRERERDERSRNEKDYRRDEKDRHSRDRRDRY